MSTGLRHPPRWKSIASHLVDWPLRKWTSEKNGGMELMLSRGEYKLCTANAVYSFGRHYRSFSRAFEALDIYSDTDIRSVLVLGWGLGSIGDLLNGHAAIERMTGIEYDQTLIDCYRDLDPELSFELVLECRDGMEFVRSSKSRFDLVCSDIFIDNRTPDAVIREEYLAGLSGLLNPNGRCLLSKLHQSAADHRQNRELEANLEDTGIQFGVVNSIGNRVYHWQSGSA